MANLLTLLLLLVTTQAVPQRNLPQQQLGLDGHEFVELLPEDFTEEEYDILLDEFVEFLERKELLARGDFVDVDNLQCTPKIGKYTAEDPVQCDKFYECDTNGRLHPKLCPDGLVYDIPGKSCNHPQRVECEARTELQEPTPTDGCERLNGYFNPEDPLLCNEYTTCVDGHPTPGKCSTGVVWSPSILACTRPDQSKRPECVAAEVKEFICPEQRKLRFGNHDRLQHPTDCGQFYVCFPNGNFNKAACDKPMVFDPPTGSCKPAEEVQGCEFYNKTEEELRELEELYEDYE